MSEFKDPKIKLFGKTIQLPDSSAAAAAAAVEAASVENGESVSGESGEAAGEDSSNQDPSCTSDSMSEDSNLNRDAEEEQSPESLSDPPKQDHPKGESKDSIHTEPIIEDSNEASETTSNSQQDKTLKKPDKIIPCPRCNSMETKFCYFNNYNVNQPRHFCKNCQRYWTAGGTMRNVPVGAGRRKNKNSTPQFHHLIVPEALPNGGHHPPTLNPNATLLTFGSDSPTPLCKSMSSVLHINGPPHKPEEQRDADVANTTGLPELMPNYHPFPPGGPLPYPWNPVQWAPHVPPPGMRFPVPFYPTPYWACPVPGPWNVPWVIPPPSCGPASPTLGKHAREENLPEASSTTEEGRSEKCLWFPKTLRIDDHGEAAKSSIWATLGLKNDGVDSVVGGGLFKAFVSQSKGDEEKSHVSEASAVLQANPAAFSRSAIFHETS